MSSSALLRLSIPALALIGSAGAFGQVPSKCLEIESVLVDACNNNCPGAQEGENEMFRFITGPSPIALSNLAADWATQNAFLGWVQNAATASLTAQLNATITNCGWLLEPPNGVIPPGRLVLGITSTAMCINGNSLAGLSDTLYVIYQAPGNTFGHFKNTNNSNAITPNPTGTNSFRTFILQASGSTSCSDSVTYNEALLVNQVGTYGGNWAQNDGSTVAASWPGVPQLSYMNQGCQAPIVPMTAEILSDPVPVPCGATVPLVGAASGNIASVFWTGGAGTYSDPNGTATAYTLDVAETNGAILSFCAVSICGDTLCDQVQIPVDPAPVPAIVSAPPSIACDGAATMIGEVTGSAVGTFWSGGAGAWSNVSAAGATYAPGPEESGDVGLSFCAVSACGDTVCTGFTLTVQGDPAAGIAADGPTTFCAGQAVLLTASGGTGYLWSTGATGASIMAQESGLYSVTVTSACGASEASITITVLPPPVAEASGPATACPGQPFTLEASGGATYTWSTGATTASAVAYQPGSYAVVVADACGSDTATVTVAQGESFAPVFTADASEGCAPLRVRFTADQQQDALYTWTFGDGGTATGGSAEHCFAAGAYTVSLSAAPNGYAGLCPATWSLPVPINAWPAPTAAFAVSPPVTTIEEPDIRLIDGSVGADSLTWTLGDGWAVSTERSPAFRLDSVACYPIRLQALNTHGCIAEASGAVCIEDPFLLWVPNAFTPNGDGFNDTFFAVTSVAQPREFTLSVFDRWGRSIFTSTSPVIGWDGSDAPNDLYVWRLWIRDTLGKRHERTGHVTLIR
jgi:gliding motility-associated-like protein